MIYEIYSENGTKKKRALTGNGYGVPLGAIIEVYSNLVPDGYLPCNGAVYDTTTYAALYAYLGSNRLPDLRECNLVGAGRSSNDYDASTNPNGIHEHDVYAVGEFKDDQIQGHWHKSYGGGNASGVTNYNGIQYSNGSVNNSSDITIREPITDGTNGTPRVGTTTHGKQVGVNYCIKATPAYVEPDTVSDMVNTLRTQDSYSTSEVNTGKKWIDGKPIYRKTWVWQSLATSLDLSSFNVDEIVKKEGFLYLSNGEQVTLDSIFHYAGGNIWFEASYNKSTKLLSFSVGGTFRSDETVTLEYTKTTD